MQIELTRRGALWASLAAVGAAAGPALAGRRLFGPGGLPVGINVYMVASSWAADPAGTLKRLADIGFREFESDLSKPPEVIRDARLAAGLACAAVSVLPKPLRGGLSLETDPGELARAVH